MKQFPYQSIFDIWVRLEMNVDSSELQNKTKKLKNEKSRKYAKFEKEFISWSGFNDQDSNILGLKRHCSHSSLCTSFNNRGCSRHFVKSIRARGEKTVEWCHIPWSNWQIFTSPFRHQRNCLIKKRYLKLDQGTFKEKSNYLLLFDKVRNLIFRVEQWIKTLVKVRKVGLKSLFFQRAHVQMVKL